jgi:Trk-type K+ transport system membrane component
MKVVRLTMLFRQALAEMRYLVWPRGVFTVRLNTRAVRKNTVYGVYAFVFLYLVTMFAGTLVVASAGYDIVTSLTTSLATLGNIGPGFGLVGPATNYAHFPDYVKIVLSCLMMTGRLFSCSRPRSGAGDAHPRRRCTPGSTGSPLRSVSEGGHECFLQGEAPDHDVAAG